MMKTWKEAIKEEMQKDEFLLFTEEGVKVYKNNTKWVWVVDTFTGEKFTGHIINEKAGFGDPKFIHYYKFFASEMNADAYIEENRANFADALEAKNKQLLNMEKYEGIQATNSDLETFLACLSDKKEVDVTELVKLAQIDAFEDVKKLVMKVLKNNLWYAKVRKELIDDISEWQERLREEEVAVYLKIKERNDPKNEIEYLNEFKKSFEGQLPQETVNQIDNRINSLEKEQK